MPIIEEVEERRCHIIKHIPVIIVQAVGTPCKLFLLMPETVINYNPCPSSIHRKSQFLPSHQMSDATVKRYFPVTYIHTSYLQRIVYMSFKIRTSGQLNQQTNTVQCTFKISLLPREQSCIFSITHDTPPAYSFKVSVCSRTLTDSML